MSSSEKFNVAYSVDSNYIWPFLVSIYSANLSAHNHINFFLASTPNSLSKLEIQIIQGFTDLFNIDLKFLQLPAEENIITVNHVSASAYNKFRIPELIKHKYLWLDSDTLCCEGWDQVFALKISKVSVAAARIVPNAGIKPLTSNMAKIRAKENYFNSGVMLVDGGHFVDQQLGSKWMSIASQRDQLGFDFNDQDVWNYLISDEITRLPVSFNFYADGRDGLGFGHIIHFLGPKKPWQFRLDQKQFLQITGLFVRSDKTKGSLLFDMNLNCFTKYWDLERQLLANVREINIDLHNDLIEIQELSKRNHFSTLLNFKIFVLTTVFKLLSTNIFGRAK